MNCKSAYLNEEFKEDILNIINETDDLYEALNENNIYDYHYCLNYLRENLFLWYPFKENGSLLEIGAGCGQLTNLFCEKLNKVVSVEIDDVLVEIIKKRCTSDNLTVLRNEFSDIETEEKFDYIVLCDIFEYVKHFSMRKNPYADYLSYLKRFLKDDGVILIAISNYKFFYPFPDHRFPDVISTDDFINKIPYARLPVYFDKRSRFFREHKLNQKLAKDNISQYFSNSFLLEIRNNDEKRDTDDLKYLKLSPNRNKEFRTITSIHQTL